jgi:pentafunctional AROM polypeptide
MGCTVIQTETTTTVTGPYTLQPLTIDMESMTDAFMTAVVLGAVAQSDSRPNQTIITGIANQRVKECDRIAAMITQLKKLGVEASELKDGIVVNGITPALLKKPNAIECYDDHRIAMSFSILMCAFPGPSPVIMEKKCVEKTWPQWWDCLGLTLGVETIGVDLQLHDLVVEGLKNVEPKSLAEDKQNKSVVLVGMRGVGKTTMGKVAAQHLDFSFIDMDDYFETQTQTKIPEFVEKNGWSEFRRVEAELLEKVLIEHSLETVISCGGGVVETESSIELLKGFNGLVVHLKRNKTLVKQYLQIDKTRPLYHQDLEEVWIRRDPLYHAASNADFVILSPREEAFNPVSEKFSSRKTHPIYKSMNIDFCNFLDFKLQRIQPKLLTGLSFFLCLTCTDIDEILPIIDEISIGADALELRVDLLQSNSLDFVQDQIAMLKYSSNLPIIFTVRTIGEGGRFSGTEEERIELLNCGIRSGCEFIDVEFHPNGVEPQNPFRKYDHLLSIKGNALIIGSYHDCQGLGTWTENGSMVAKYKELHPLSDIVKLIGRASDFADNFNLYNFQSKTIPGLELVEKPLISLLMGRVGQLSRHLNTFMTPVTHELLPVSAAPGQVTIREIHLVIGF